MENSLLFNSNVVRVQNAAAAGTTNLTGSTIDTSGYDAVQFIYGLGALTATQQTKLKVQGGNAANGSDAADLAGTGAGFAADADSNKTLISEVIKPAGFRYLTPVLLRGTANAVVDFGIAILYKIRKKPSTPDATVSKQVSVVSPALGTP